MSRRVLLQEQTTVAWQSSWSAGHKGVGILGISCWARTDEKGTPSHGHLSPQKAPNCFRHGTCLGRPVGVTQPPESLGQMGLLFPSCSGHFKNAWEKLLGEVQHLLLCSWSFPRGSSVGLVPSLYIYINASK